MCVHKRESVPWPTAKGVCGDVGGMREAKSIEVLQVHEVELDNGGKKPQHWGPQILREMMGQVDAY